MRKNLLVIVAGFLAAISIIITPTALAASKDQNKTVVLPKEENYEGLYARAATTIDINGNINGDAILAGSNVNINGNVNGNVYIAGNNINIKGKIAGSAHLAGNIIDVSGEIGKSAYIAGNMINLNDNSKVGTSLVSFGSTANINGSIGTQAYLYNGINNINGSIGSDANINGGQINIGSKASINGNLKYSSDSQAQIANDSKITGSISKVEQKNQKTDDFRSKLMATVLGLVSTFLLGLMFVWGLPKSTVDVADYVDKHLLGSIFCGLLFLILVPIVVILALITGIGAHIGIVLGLSYVAVLLSGGVFIALWLGRKITKTKDTHFSQNIWALAIGLVIVAVISLIPVVGGLISFIAFLAGVGGLTFRTYNRFKMINRAQAK